MLSTEDTLSVSRVIDQVISEGTMKTVCHHGLDLKWDLKTLMSSPVLGWFSVFQPSLISGGPLGTHYWINCSTRLFTT